MKDDLSYFHKASYHFADKMIYVKTNTYFENIKTVIKLKTRIKIIFITFKFGFLSYCFKKFLERNYLVWGNIVNAVKIKTFMTLHLYHPALIQMLLFPDLNEAEQI